eukprot:COSAG01_NODE_16930_length_1192_cov_496.066789_1_plen_202_part_00
MDQGSAQTRVACHCVRVVIQPSIRIEGFTSQWRVSRSVAGCIRRHLCLQRSYTSTPPAVAVSLQFCVSVCTCMLRSPSCRTITGRPVPRRAQRRPVPIVNAFRYYYCTVALFENKANSARFCPDVDGALAPQPRSLFFVLTTSQVVRGDQVPVDADCYCEIRRSPARHRDPIQDTPFSLSDVGGAGTSCMAVLNWMNLRSI